MSLVTIITPTTGKNSLHSLIEMIGKQTVSDTYHLLLWDDKREANSLNPEEFNSSKRHSIVCPPGTGRQGAAPGSMLRSIALMAAKTPWVTFADDDVWWNPEHLEKMLAVPNVHWVTTLRKIWTNSETGLSYLGVDRFESVGDDHTRNVPYEMCDGNTMMFKRELGVAAAHMFRETTEYNDDRLMYAFLKKHAGPRGKTNLPTISQICPDKLTDFFRTNCSPE